MVNIVDRWIDACVGANSRPECILCFDSHYLSAASRQYANSMKNQIKYSCSVQKNRINGIWTQMERVLRETNTEVRKPGDYEAIHNRTSGEHFVFSWDEDQNVGKKYNLSNAIIRYPRPTRCNEEKNKRSSYDIYKKVFNLCDTYNRSLHDRKWPFKHGGKDKPGEWGLQDDFAFSSILQNTFNLYNIDLNNIDVSEYSFEGYCIILSDELYIYAGEYNQM